MSRWILDAEALRHVCPNLTAKDATQIAAGLGEAFHKYDITTERRAAMAVAQWAHECDRFRTATEYASGAAYEGRNDLGNTRAGDGRRFKGRGRIMITGRANYAKVAEALGIDCVNNPSLLAQCPHSELASGHWWHSSGCNGFCDKDDFRGLTRRINGGLNGLDDRQALYSRARAVAGRLVPKDPWNVLTKEERKMMDALTEERRSAKRNGGWEEIDASHLKRASEAKRWLIDRRKEIWRSARASQDGWTKNDRQARYALIKAATDE